jgi:predicted DsbA family dithiol-disulfide isomerase
MIEPTILEIFSDYTWPWCYFITGRIKKLKKEFNIEIRWIEFPLHPDIPEGGLTFEELLSGRNIDVNQMLSHLKNAADQAGLPLNDPQKAYNTRLAQEVGKWASTKGKGDEFHDITFKAYFVDEKNISDRSVLLDLVKSIGLPYEKAKDVIENRTFKEAVDKDWSRSRGIFVTSVPTFLMNMDRLVGAQPYDALREFMKNNNVAPIHWSPVSTGILH